MDGGPTAPVDGTLVESDGCLWVDAAADGSRSLVLWPDNATLVEDDGRLVVRQAGNEAIVGQPMRATGGQYNHEDHYEFVIELIGEEIPEECQASHFWLVYDANTVDQ